MNRFLKPLNNNRAASSFDSSTPIAPAPLFTADGEKVCSDYKVLSGEAGGVVVRFDNAGVEMGREKAGARELYEADFDAIDIKAASKEEAAFLFNNLHPPKNASKEQRQRFYQLQKVAAGICNK